MEGEGASRPGSAPGECPRAKEGLPPLMLNRRKKRGLGRGRGRMAEDLAWLFDSKKMGY